MSLYVVGFYKPHYGDALVSARSASHALSVMRAAGFTPNPGDRYLLDSPAQRANKDYVGEIDDWMREKAREDGIVVIWSGGGT